MHKYLFYQFFNFLFRKNKREKRNEREKLEASRPPSAQGFVVLPSAFF